MKGLLLVNVQNDFVTPDGTLFYGGTDDLPQKIADYVRNMGTEYDHIYAVKDWHKDSHRCLYDEDHEHRTPHCDEGAKGAEFHDDILEISSIFTNVFHDTNGYPLEAECVNPVTGEVISRESLLDALYTDDIDELHVCGVGEPVNSVVFDLGDIDVHVLAPLVDGGSKWMDQGDTETYYMRGVWTYENDITVHTVLETNTSPLQDALF